MPTEFGGRVFDVNNGQPLPNVDVSIPARALTVRTNNQGIYIFGIIESGTVEVVFTHRNYQTFTRSKELPDLTSTELVVALIPKSEPPPGGNDECIVGTTFCDGRIINECVRGGDSVARWQPTIEICDLPEVDNTLIIAGVAVVAAVVLFIVTRK